MADYEGGAGSTDPYRSRLVDGQYSTPESLGAPINSAHYEDEPFIAADESFLLFASSRPGKPGEGRLFVSLRSEEGSWGQPRGFASRLGMTGAVRFPQLSPDGRFLFFASNENGNWDVYWVDIGVLSDLLPGSPARE